MLKQERIMCQLASTSVKPVLWIGIVLMPVQILIRFRFSILMPIQIRILPQVLHMLENHVYFTFDYITASLHARLCHKYHNFQFFKLYIEYFCKNFSIFPHLVKTDIDSDLAPDPDGQNLDADPDPAKKCRSVQRRVKISVMFPAPDNLGKQNHMQERYNSVPLVSLCSTCQREKV
jgi:hypothetical protein